MNNHLVMQIKELSIKVQYQLRKVRTDLERVINKTQDNIGFKEYNIILSIYIFQVPIRIEKTITIFWFGVI